MSALNRSRSLFLTVSLVILLPVATGVLWSAVSATRTDDGKDSVYKYLAIFSEVFGLVRSSYVDAPDPEVLLGGALDGVADALDPFSNLVPAAALDDYRRTVAVGSTHSGVRIAKEHGIAFVVAVEPGSPGAAAGIERGDLIAEIDGEQTRAAPLWRLESHLAGPIGETVALRVLRDGESLDVELVLAEYETPTPALVAVRSVHHLSIPRIDPAAPARVRELLAGLAASEEARLLVDLRGTAGGDFEAAYEIGALFASGELGRLEHRDGAEREFRSDAEPVWKGRLVVLVNGGTLGAGEVLAAVLREGAGADLVGLRTFGWAGERSYLELSGGVQLHLTTSFYTGPSGERIARGLAPQVVVDELSRRLDENDRSLEELIFERGVELLLAEGEAERRAA